MSTARLDELQQQLDMLRKDLDATIAVVNSGVDKIGKNEEMLNTLTLKQAKIESNIELVKAHMLTKEDFQDVLNKQVAKIFWALLVGVFTGFVAWVVNVLTPTGGGIK